MPPKHNTVAMYARIASLVNKSSATAIQYSVDPNANSANQNPTRAAAPVAPVSTRRPTKTANGTRQTNTGTMRCSGGNASANNTADPRAAPASVVDGLSARQIT